MSVDDKSNPESSAQTGAFDRRSFLQVLGLAFSSAALPQALVGCTDASEPDPFVVDDLQSLVVSKTIHVVRPEDMLVLTLGLVNLRVAGGAMSRLASGPAFIVIDFPPQAIVEDAALLTSARVPEASWANANLG